MQRLIPVICVITMLMNFYCTKKLDDVQKKAEQEITRVGDTFFITDSAGNQIPAIQYKVDFKWVDSVKAETYVKLYDKTTGAWYHFSTWNVLPQVQETYIPKYHQYDIYWYNYSQQGHSPDINKKMVIHSGTVVDSIQIQSNPILKIRPNVDYSANNTILTNFTISGW